MPTIIIRDQLVGPPTWIYSFRDLTLFCTVFLHRDVVVESDVPDLYSPWLRSRRCHDFVKDFVRPGSERGVRIDIESRFSAPTFVTDRIVPENLNRILKYLQPYRDRTNETIERFLRS